METHDTNDLQGFLTAVKQEVNRRHANDKWALDDVVMTAEVLHPAKEVDQIRDAPQEGVYIYGLFLDGCAWSNKDGKLVDSEPKKLYHPLPVIYVTGVQVFVLHILGLKLTSSVIVTLCSYVFVGNVNLL